MTNASEDDRSRHRPNDLPPAGPFWLLLEDDKLVASALARILRRHAQVRHASVVKGALRLLKENLWRCCGLVLDINLPDGSGLDVLEHVRDRGMNTPAIVITASNKHDEISRAQRLGAQFLWKPWLPENLDAFIQGALRSSAPQPNVNWQLVDGFPHRKLSPRETDILSQAMADATPEQIAGAMKLSRNTIKTVLQRIKKKAGVTSIGDLKQRLRDFTPPASVSPETAVGTPRDSRD